MLGPPPAELCTQLCGQAQLCPGRRKNKMEDSAPERERGMTALTLPRDPGSSGSQSPVTGERFRDDAVASTVLPGR